MNIHIFYVGIINNQVSIGYLPTHASSSSKKERVKSKTKILKYLEHPMYKELYGKEKDLHQSMNQDMDEGTGLRN